MNVVPISRIFRGMFLRYLTRYWIEVLLSTVPKSYLTSIYMMHECYKKYAIHIHTSNFYSRHWFLSNLKCIINNYCFFMATSLVPSNPIISTSKFFFIRNFTINSIIITQNIFLINPHRTTINKLEKS